MLSAFRSALPISLLLTGHSPTGLDTSWHPPNKTAINDLDRVLHDEGVYDFIFDSSDTPNVEYGRYNWCNMPHVRRIEYPTASDDYQLQYVEVIHRHHKRTPYQSNTFPVEAYPWDCDDQVLPIYGEPVDGTQSSKPYWNVFRNSLNPFPPSGFEGSCRFPQITKEGLDDSWQHGRDLREVYHDLLGLIPSTFDHDKVRFRATTNVITSQVAGMLINGMHGTTGRVPLDVESESSDSLEPSYSCPRSSALFSEAREEPGTPWADHLKQTKSFFEELDSVSGVSPSDSDWHTSFDHYFDNLSARLCHSKPLPCKIGDSSKCITREQADKVFRLGQFEYSYIYRDSAVSLAASAGSLGVWVAELAQHIRHQIAGEDRKTVYRHNIAHDGSIARLLSILQVDVMVWPGMGAEVVFELYTSKKDGETKRHFVRVLFGGQVIRSSNPDLGRLDMIPAAKLLEYFDGLVGKRADLVPVLCQGKGKMVV